MAKKVDDHLGVGPLSVTVANEGFQEAPTEYVIILVVTGILGGGQVKFSDELPVAKCQGCNI